MKQVPNPAQRARSFAARPERVPCMGSHDCGDGGLSITVEVQRPGWQRMLGASVKARRTFELDYLGRNVYEACDGAATVADIARKFADEHQISLPEAEVATTQFLKTLMTKGLIAMAVDREVA